MTKRPNDLLEQDLPKPVNPLFDTTVIIKDQTLTRHDDYFTCSCLEWQKQKARPYNCRTCIHLIEYFGEQFEKERLYWIASRISRVTEDQTNKKPKVMGKPKQGGRASTAVKYKEPGLLLAQKWTETTNVEGFWISEKLDGVRAYYDHELGIFISRLGNVFQVPEFFYKGFPKDIMSLDGELYLGRGQYALTQQVLKVSDHPKWAEMKFMAFDSPSTPGVFEDRLQAVKDYFANNECPHAHVVEHQLCQSKEHMDELLKHFETLGGEGVMLRKPKSHYVPKRSATLLKVKSFYDAEARVTEHIPGKGKYTGMMGALLCQMASGVSFKVGTGFSDRDRLNPPPIGAIITYRFQEMTPDNAPRFPAFVAVRSDMTEPKDCEIPAHRRRGDDDEA